METGGLSLPDHEETERLVALALAEDVGRGDLTTGAIIPADARLDGVFRARTDLVLAGLFFARAVFRHLDPDIRLSACAREGEGLAPGDEIAEISGRAAPILVGERTALNMMQHLCGIASVTRAYVSRLAGTGATLLDTRKTIPGLRQMEKYAVRAGGGTNHRQRLDDGVLIKDNHIAVAGSVAEAVRRARVAGLDEIQVECDTLAQVEAAIAAGAPRLLLDNMALEDMREAVALARRSAPGGGRVLLEASGGVSLETVRAIAETGVDFISVGGALTLSAPAADIGLDYSPAR